MPVYTIQGPDGKTYDVEGPAGATADQLGQFILSQNAPQAPQGSASGASLPNRIATGMGDIVHGGAQLLAHALPSGAVDAVNRGADALASIPGIGPILKDVGIARSMTPAQIDQNIQQREQQYQEDRKAAGQSGFDGGRLSGNLAVGVPLAMSIPGGTGLLTRTAASAAGGATSGATSPVTSGDFADEKRRQLMLSTLLGGAAPGATSAVARVVQPKVDPLVKALLDEKVVPTMGQILGPTAAKIEEKLTSVPLLGDMIKGSQQRSVDDFNRAAYARALEGTGKAPSGAVGREGVQEVKDTLGSAYQNLLPKLQFKADSQFGQEISHLQAMAQNGNMPPEIARQFDSILKNEVFSRMTKQGAMDGQAFKDMESVLSQKIKSFGSSPSPNDRAIADGLREVLDSSRKALQRANPGYADELGKINQGYANYARIRDAASRQGSADGVFTPAQLAAAVRAADKSAGKGNYATGNALMQDLSEAGKSVLGTKVPNSGTADRMLIPAAALGASTGISPLIPAAAGVAMLPYSKVGQKMMAALLTKRPDMAEQIAEAIRNTAPALGVASYPLIQGN
jgi:hypothetical protein